MSSSGHENGMIKFLFKSVGNTLSSVNRCLIYHQNCVMEVQYQGRPEGLKVNGNVFNKVKDICSLLHSFCH